MVASFHGLQGSGRRLALGWLLLSAGWLALTPARAAVVFETTSAYHHIRVVDEGGVRTLSFDRSQESRMSLRDPTQGHFEYTEYFHLPWLWNPKLKRVLMIGLGGGSTQRAYQRFYPDVVVDAVELDPMVVAVAKTYFHVRESPTLRLHVSDGRVFLRRAPGRYDAIILDAYTTSRYGSFIPWHLATKEFFEIARDRLYDNGVLAYNVMGTLTEWRADILGSMYATLKSVFPHVYLFPAKDSMNVVLIATQSPQAVTLPELEKRAAELVKSGRVKMPTFQTRVRAFRAEPPPSAARAPVLRDDFAPVDGLLRAVKPK